MKKLIQEKNAIDIEHCFLKCKALYQTCIKNEGNEYLKDELEVPFSDLILQNESINFIVNSDVFGETIIDVRIKLYSRKLKKQLGSYRYVENLNGEPIDDFLIFV